jgi:hypothetical protein
MTQNNFCGMPEYMEQFLVYAGGYVLRGLLISGDLLPFDAEQLKSNPKLSRFEIINS